MSVRPPRKPVVKPILVVVGVVDSAAVCAQCKEKRMGFELDRLVGLRVLGLARKARIRI